MLEHPPRGLEAGAEPECGHGWVAGRALSSASGRVGSAVTMMKMI